ncbi:HNH endonuclease [Archangium lipolyticum]|uniref:HNH endonuclease n=1 Tax=Archangium lipolyticum TaxID=2970465 RepID=UPI00214A3BE5|nr:HNH endonuclease [Archangium lipolyticum]
MPTSALPEDGRTLFPAQAMELLPHLLSTPVTLGNFGPRRMAAHLLLEVATGGVPVSRDELHARMRRFARLLVVRPDGYLVKPATGVAVQKAGEVVLAKDGTLRADRFEVGPFYAMEGGHLFSVDDALEVPHGSFPVGRYEPDDGVLLPVVEGAVLAVVDTVEGLYRLAFHPRETLEGLTQLPGVVRELYENAPQRWDAFRHKPYAEKVRTMSRLATGAVLLVGTSGAGAAKAASWGGRLGNVSIPLLSLSGDGLMAVRLVALPVGGVVSAAAPALGATYVLHMANARARGTAGNGSANDRTHSGVSTRTPPGRYRLHFIEPWRKPQLTADGRIIPYKGTRTPPEPIVNLGRNRAGQTVSDGKTAIVFDKDGFPEFDTSFETLLDDVHIGSRDRLAHYKAANQKLFQSIREDPSLGRALGLSPEAVDKLPTSTKPPTGYSWHHHQDVGRMQLIMTKSHLLAAPHTGGMAIWGGGP